MAKILVVQWTRIVNNDCAHSNDSLEAKERSCQQLLTRIYTPPTSKDLYPDFEITKQPIESWFIDEPRYHPPGNPDLFADEYRRAVDGPFRSRNLPMEILKEIMVNAEQSEQNEKTQQAMDAMRKAAFLLPSSRVSSQEVLSDLFNVSYDKMYAADLTPTDLALFTGSTSAKVDIVLELAKHELFCWRVTNQYSKDKIVEWQSKVNQMNSFRTRLENGRTANTEIGQEMQDILKQIERLEKALENLDKFDFHQRVTEKSSTQQESVSNASVSFPPSTSKAKPQL